MNMVSVQIPGFGNIPQPDPLGTKFPDLGSIISSFLNIIFFLAVFLAFYWLVWGAWAYIFAGGEKESLAKARNRIKWAIIGMLVTLMSFLIAKYAGEIFTPGRGGVPF
ncbi:hypothetical protein A3B42_00945 [Candidatus Daviesbacteria bacterium RIFCSPLOWO2_01_FULL_38_10]|nr:MAG: hypothetical protein A3B42_00945 [Candidatus Daviesbacteria bacterium RIFCSPLOWO2_01_FULL_38_10]OGE45577.1 MAG: hypothetical protein A3E67_03275 [Candidatus Daviesbacteria bacterium RIFCSPHIGHO2_12_FULL_38_25]OGE73031.1 MAG: hypothetical protein A3H18_02200 [Candidatus Daviesbacteria bacterium RIFCSPLOWO2_12_FULL_38_10]